MKATGIVRRIDDLGRVVIPKEIRRTLRIREGDPLEIFTEKDGSVIFKKYSLMDDQSEFAQQVCDAMYRATGGVAVVTDRDMIVACAGAPRKELAERRLSPELGQVMEARQLYRGTKDGPPALLCQGEPSLEVLAAAPVLSGGDLLGCVAYAGGGGVAGETECKLAQAMANFLGRHMEQ